MALKDWYRYDEFTWKKIGSTKEIKIFANDEEGIKQTNGLKWFIDYDGHIKFLKTKSQAISEAKRYMRSH